jgi:hypothetical protein
VRRTPDTTAMSSKSETIEPGHARLRVVYTTPMIRSGDESIGIQQRLDAMIEAWAELGVDGWIIPWPGARERHTRPAWQTLWSLLTGGRQLQRTIAAQDPDVVIARVPLWMPWLRRLARGRWILVSESHGTDPGPKRPIELLGGRVIARRARGISFITQQMAAGYTGNKPTFVTGNSSDLPRLPAPDNARPRVMYAAANALPHQGLDLFVEIARQCTEFDFDLVVPPATPLPDVALPGNLRLAAALNRTELIDIMSRADIALGTLALSRKRARYSEPMRVSPLKVRDSIASGIPTLVPYHDELVVGIHDPLLVYAPQLDADLPGLVAAVRDLASRGHGERLHASSSRAASTLEHERRRIAFLKRLVSDQANA